MAKKEKITLQELIVQTPELKSSLLKFENVKLQLDKAAETCLQIKVIDDASLSICENQLGKINELVKAVENVRVSEKAPHFEKCKAIDAAAAYVSELPESALKHLKDQKIAWIRNKDEEKTRRDKLGLDYIKLREYLEACYASRHTLDRCEYYLNELSKPVNKEKWQEATPQVEALYKSYHTLFLAKKQELENGVDLFTDNTEAIEEAKANIESAVVEETPIETISKVRRSWAFEVVDVSLVPLHFLMVDESKVKAYMKANSDSLEDGKVVNGIKYYKYLKVTV